MDPSNKKLTIQSGATFELASGAITAVADKILEAADIALTTGSILIGASGAASALDMKADGALLIGNGTTAAAKTTSGDVTISNGGVTTIGSAKVTSAMLANGAGLASVITAGLGNSVSYVKTDDGTKTILAAHASKDRGVLVVAVVDEAFADAGGTQPVVEIGEEATIDKCFDHTIFVGAAKGTIFCKGFLNTATKAIVATLNKAVTTGTGGASFAVLALPNS
jgi:hypothetical protein